MRQKVTCCLSNIEDELHHPIDTHSSIILSRHIELLLDYCTRYYERQFITRENKNKALLENMERLFVEYIASGRLQGGKLPTPGYMAGELDLSVAYFNDLLKFETGKTLEEYLQLKRLDIARHMLLQDGHTPAAVARKLGYPNVQCFSVLFKKITGVAPVVTGSRRIDNRVAVPCFCDTVPFCKNGNSICNLSTKNEWGLAYLCIVK